MSMRSGLRAKPPSSATCASFSLAVSFAGMAAGIFCLWLSVALEGTYGVMSSSPEGVLRGLLLVFGAGVLTASEIYPRLQR